MTKVLVPVDGSVNALHAVDFVIKEIRDGRSLEVHLLNVQPQILSGHARMYLKKDLIDEYYQEEAEKALKPAREKLDNEGIKYSVAHLVGNIADVIARYIKSTGCEMVVMGTRGLGSVHSMVLGSVATKVLHQVEVPVTLVK
ncbi:MAG TPA: universal stress protein [Lautropia sp.]|nr:universal stress protein [Lautropia sp.]